MTEKSFSSEYYKISHPETSGFEMTGGAKGTRNDIIF